MNKNYFEIKRAGINTTFQDQGRGNLYHIGIPFSGAMDNRNFQISNKLVGNEVNLPTIEFAYQGPLLKYFGENINFAIAGDVKFIIRKKSNTIEVKGIVASKMSDEQIESFKTSLDETLGKKTKLSIEVDPSLIGGIKLRIDNTFLDASIHNQLQTLRTELLQT